MTKLGTVLGFLIKDAPVKDAPPLNQARLVADALADIRDMDREHFVVFYLNARSQVIASYTVSVGTLSASLVHPREVFKGAILRNAAAIIVAHNHPSGNIEASPEDRDCTRRLAQAGTLLGIPLLDHVIVGAMSAEYTSFKERGLMPCS